MNRGLGIKAKQCLYKGVIVPMALYGIGTNGIEMFGWSVVNG